MKRLFALLIILALTPLSAQSTVRDCEELATQIGQNAGLPQHLLPAIARIESGRSLNGKLANAKLGPGRSITRAKGFTLKQNPQLLTT